MSSEPRTVLYRARSGPWGIWIRLTASVEQSPRPPQGGDRVAPRLLLDTRPVRTHPGTDRSGCRLHPAEADWLRHGLALAAPGLPPRSAQVHTLVTVHRVLFPEADYQPEGLAAALLLWLEEEFALPPHAVSATFDSAADRYVYDWGGLPR